MESEPYWVPGPSHKSTRSAKQSIHQPHLCNPEPDLLEEVSWFQLWPLSILSIKCCLTSVDIGISWGDPLRALKDLPEAEKQEEDWNSDIRGEEIYGR